MTGPDQDDRWYAQLDSGEVALMTLDELQQAFEAGSVHANTFVVQAGQENWQTLGQVAGLEDEAPRAPGPAPQGSYQQQAAHQHAGMHQPAMPSAAPIMAPAAAAQPMAPVAAAPRAQYAVSESGFKVPIQSGAPPAAARPQQPVASAFPPAVAAALADRAPHQASVSAPLSAVADTLSHDLGSVGGAEADFGAGSFKASRGRMVAIAAAAVAILGGIGVAASQIDNDSEPNMATAQMAASPAAKSMIEQMKAAERAEKAAPASERKSAADSAAAASAPEADDEDTKPQASERFSEDVKRSLLEADKKRAKQLPKKKGGAAGPARSGKPGREAGTFSKGGDAYDPLNDGL